MEEKFPLGCEGMIWRWNGVSSYLILIEEDYESSTLTPTLEVVEGLVVIFLLDYLVPQNAYTPIVL